MAREQGPREDEPGPTSDSPRSQRRGPGDASEWTRRATLRAVGVVGTVGVAGVTRTDASVRPSGPEGAPGGVLGGSRATQSALANGKWRQRAKLAAADGNAGDHFGVSVAVDGSTAVVGAPGDRDRTGQNAGSVYLFEYDGDWRQVTRLTPDDGDFGDKFGGSVAVDGSTVVVGAPWDEHPNGERAGSAYVFEHDGGWQQVAKLTPDDGDAVDHFGKRVAVDGSTAVVGERGAEYTNEYHDIIGNSDGSAYVFEKDGGWQQVAKLTLPGSESGDLFGVAVDGSTAVIGTVPTSVGSTYVFENDGGWQQVARFAAGAGGGSVAMDDATVVVGAPQAKDSNGEEAGAVYVFENDGGWQQVAKLTPDKKDNEYSFGASVAVDGSTAVIGAHADEAPNGEEAGAAYIFELDEGWQQVTKLTAADGDTEDHFGASVAVDGSTAVIGVYGDEDPNGENAGSAYVFGSGVRSSPTATPTGDDADGGAASSLPGLGVLTGIAGLGAGYLLARGRPDDASDD